MNVTFKNLHNVAQLQTLKSGTQTLSPGENDRNGKNLTWTLRTKKGHYVKEKKFDVTSNAFH